MDHSTHSVHQVSDHQQAGQSSDSDALKDPVCGMKVTAQSTHYSEHMGHSFFFCGPKCKAKFDANPMQYMGVPHENLAVQPVAAGTVYTCPMHPEIRQAHPGSCPKCGMALEPVMPSLEDEENPELLDFQHRFWWTLPLTAVVFVLAMFGHRLQLIAAMVTVRTRTP